MTYSKWSSFFFRFLRVLWPTNWALDENSWVSSSASCGGARYLFYRPVLWIGNLYFWGLRPGIFRRRERFEGVLECVLETPTHNSRVPIGMPFQSVLPQTNYTLERIDIRSEVSPSEKVVWCEGPSANGLLIQHRTNSYFHFITEIIPLVLHYKGDDSIGVIVTRGWQIEALQNFGLKISVQKPERTRHFFIVQKRTWGVFPREDLILNARKTLQEGADFPSRGSSTNSGLLVTRSANTSTTGRLLSSSTNQSLITALGVGKYDPARDTVRQQFRTFGEHQKFVGPHGSAFANLVAAREKSVVVEINHYEHSQWHVKRLCDIFQFSYKLCAVPSNKLGHFELGEGTIEKIRRYMDSSF